MIPARKDWFDSCLTEWLEDCRKLWIYLTFYFQISRLPVLFLQWTYYTHFQLHVIWPWCCCSDHLLIYFLRQTNQFLLIGLLKQTEGLNGRWAGLLCSEPAIMLVLNKTVWIIWLSIWLTGIICTFSAMTSLFVTLAMFKMSIDHCLANRKIHTIPF